LPKLFIGTGWVLGLVTGEKIFRMGHASAHLHCAVHCFLLLSLLFKDSCAEKKQTQHASTTTPRLPLHETMYGV
jgi:hypothetical protein